MLRLDNAATPIGLRAMRELQTLNLSQDTASNAQILFLVFNASSLTLLPVSIFMCRAQQGALGYALDGIRWVVHGLGMNTDFVAALPTALVKPFSGSAARAMLIETMQHDGVDSYPALLAATMQGSTETTFYVVAVYFGAVGIRRCSLPWVARWRRIWRASSHRSRYARGSSRRIERLPRYRPSWRSRWMALDSPCLATSAALISGSRASNWSGVWHCSILSYSA